MATATADRKFAEYFPPNFGRPRDVELHNDNGVSNYVQVTFFDTGRTGAVRRTHLG